MSRPRGHGLVEEGPAEPESDALNSCTYSVISWRSVLRRSRGRPGRSLVGLPASACPFAALVPVLVG